MTNGGASFIRLSLAVAGGWVMVRLLLLFVLGIPDPKIHDEFGYLLGADTFAHGRLANPPHQLGAFFASPHLLTEPSYSPKYPPGQALFLAAGQVLFGHPFYGVVIEGALMMFLFCLMLCLWTSAWPAAIASSALVIFFQPPMYWVDSYWGGCAAASASAMLLIAIGWYRRSANPFSGCVFGAGAVLLFITRPYEGGIAFLALVLMLILNPGLLNQPPGHRRRLLVAAAYGIPVVAVGIVGVGAHNFAVTGSALVLPYQLQMKTYNVAPLLWFQSFPKTDKVYPNARLAAQHGINGWEVSAYREIQKGQHGYAGRLLTAARFLFSILPQLPLILFGRAFVDRRVWICLGLLAAGILAASFEVFQTQHYMAPSVPAMVLLWGILVERTLAVREGKFPLGAIVAGVIFFAAITPSIGATLRARSDMPAARLSWPHERTELIHRLAAAGKDNLVIVRYPEPSWNVTEEWVYNGADIDRQSVVFAHDLGAARDSELLDYYRNRTAWLLTFNPDHPDEYFLNPYPR